MTQRPHVLGIDDGPFRKDRDRSTPLVAVLMEGHDLVEGVSIREFPVDGDDVTGFLAEWIGGLRFRPSLQAVVLGGITVAGLAVVDTAGLAARCGLPVIVVNRKDPANQALAGALEAAGLSERVALLERAPASFQVEHGLHAAVAGIEPEPARALLSAVRGKSALPEPLRLAHLIGAALVHGSSRGRV